MCNLQLMSLKVKLESRLHVFYKSPLLSMESLLDPKICAADIDLQGKVLPTRLMTRVHPPRSIWKKVRTNSLTLSAEGTYTHTNK